ncbi:MAG: hypothetical protein A3I77_07220 [Gammaproteobacteria bacterium RIFCSPLOWO2_02_FULL_42_14]|nr:MAG: hypothetical protein A3B71_03055 [Gammaproteobacteria bacterium RIFCSPHIGHO2_02_FULL_42_43]OGT29381.1 MAG: hypothetical protein A2624_05030 [Gammaproteobacteria bacterium RIFCSPHIGHO2_01_FULL_42_8]OGT52466.1 MAG: hypothetical protein A3E54_00535 [Gammaproteobacteria bacterium RIFCSPHIGHO2_12_FULL_41_25]OGT61148.1 MAG: hypothetical protein A3I77_07220 [Gammaproteobacteria bacterium RIFCSPLOWO2_02_FULL_42_14]OGT87076.1 MAG: hypothetical protein A3G86_00940 [Gammaproteobacteria bacterium R
MVFKINWKRRLAKFLKHQPGQRFQHYYHLINRKINHNIYMKVVLCAIGVISFLIGIVLLFIPGPGLLFILIGIILFCLISHRFSLFLDRTEEKIRHWVERYQNGTPK